MLQSVFCFRNEYEKKKFSVFLLVVNTRSKKNQDAFVVSIYFSVCSSVFVNSRAVLLFFFNFEAVREKVEL